MLFSGLLKGAFSMKRTFLCVFLLAASGWCVFAEIPEIFIGLGPETNADTRKGAALGGVITAGMGINKHFAAGLKAGFFCDFNTVNTLEAMGFFRYYLPLPIEGFFVQAELGAPIFFEHGNVFPSFLGSLAAGWRCNLGRMFFLEPSVRGGYPFAWGVGIMVGIRRDNTEHEYDSGDDFGLNR
jgi:hypothetical protein